MRQGGALTGKFVSTSSLPACLAPGAGLDSEAPPPANSHSPSSLLQHVLLLEQARQQSALLAGNLTPNNTLHTLHLTTHPQHLTPAPNNT